MTAKKNAAQKATRTGAHVSPLSPAPFTLEERDRINSAKQRIRACVCILNPDSHGGEDWMFEDEEQSAHGFAYDILRECIDAIDAAFEAAEKRERTQKGKAA